MRVLFLLFLFAFLNNVKAQPNQGVPYITNFSVADFRQGTQNFAVIQDKRGVLYFGNSNGVLEYDGENWRLIKVDNHSEVHSLAIDDKSGRIYVGAQGDFGYLQPDLLNGKLQYISLLPLIEEKNRNFHDVWNIFVKEEGVIFHSTDGVYLLRNNSIKTIPVNASHHRSFFVHQTFFLWEEGVGLQKLKGDSLVTAPHGREFLSSNIHSMLPYSATEILLITRNDGNFLYQSSGIVPFETEVDSLLYGQNMFGTMLSSNLFAIATRSEGLLIINKQGKLIRKIDQNSGLMSSSVWDVQEDRFTENLWLALNNGISLVEVSSPFSRFGKEDEVLGQFYHLIPFDNKIFAAGSIGVYAKSWLNKEDRISRTSDFFRPVKNAGGQTWHFYAEEEELLVAGNAGILQLKKGENEFKSIGFDDRAWHLLPLKNYPDYLLANTVRGLHLLKKERQGWKVARKLAVPQESFYYFAQDSLGNIWADSPTKGIYKISFKRGISEDPVYRLFTEANGLPGRFKVRAFDFGKEVVFSTSKGVYTYNNKLNRFEPHSHWQKVLAPLGDIFIEWLELDKNGNLWFVGREETENGESAVIGYAKNEKEGYILHTGVFRKVGDLSIRDFLVVDEENVLMATSEGIIHFNPTKEIKRSFHPMVRRLELIKSDSVIFFGTYSNEEGEVVEYQPQEFYYELPYSFNSLRFHVSSPEMNNNHLNRFQFFMEEFDKGWGGWTTANSKEYTNLPEGKYLLHVRARNQYNEISDVQTFSFRILAPWYRTYWAYLFYLLLATALVAGLMRLYGTRLKRRNIKLEQLINERTHEIISRNKNIREKNYKLKEARRIIGDQYRALQDVNIRLEEKVKERTDQLQSAYQDLLLLKTELDTFIYKSSHDINGPMMRLRGLCQLAQIDIEDPNALKYIDLLQDEAEKSINVLHKLLSFYHVKNADPLPEILSNVGLEELIQQTINKTQGNDLVDWCLKQTGTLEEYQTDRELLQVILMQLLHNAVVYRRTHEPKVMLRFRKTAKGLEIRIADNGIGVPEGQEEKIFDMFYRASEKSFGPGLGLYTVRAATEKIQGSIRFYQSKGWTVFKLKLPYLEINNQQWPYSQSNGSDKGVPGINP